MKIKVNKLQARILHTLSANPGGMTRYEIQKAVKTTVILAGYLGPTDYIEFEAYEKKYKMKSLHQLGLVTVEQKEEKGGLKDIWIITKEGKKVADSVLPTETRKKNEKVPEDISIPILREFREKRSYGHKLYTLEELREVLSLISKASVDNGGEDYSWLEENLEDFRLQIENMYVRGLLPRKHREEEDIPEWYREYLESDYWQEEEIELRRLFKSVCNINPKHKGDKADLKVVHIRFNNLGGQQGRDDVLLLCRECRRRLRKSLPPIPREPTF